jgi:ATP-binding cassette, subfamily B, vacuolar membrane transporter HMT1/ACLQ
MAEPQLGLKLAFYAYPCLIFLTLLGGQSIQYYYVRRKASEPSASDAQKQKAAATRRNYERAIWALQLIVSLLLLASTIYAVLEAVTGQHEATGYIRFPFSAYVVCALYVES